MATTTAVQRLAKPLPRLVSVVVKGVGRGAGNLGWPTANLKPTEEVTETLVDVEPGVYCGWAALQSTTHTPNSSRAPDEFFKASINVGVNPHYIGKEPALNKIAEAHLLHDFGTENFQGSEIRLVLAGFLRHELVFDLNADDDPLQALTAAISQDVDNALSALDEPDFQDILNEQEAFLSGAEEP